MKILIVVNDSWTRYMDYEHTGVLTAPERRAIKIELTKDQQDKIGLREIGTKNGKPVYESIKSISITE